MDFEWDDNKNELNIKNHELDFADAWMIFEEPMLVDIDNREDYGEERFVGIGFLYNFVVVIVFTEPKEDTIRVISLRKALKHERENFEQAIGNQLGESCLVALAMAVRAGENFNSSNRVHADLGGFPQPNASTQ